GSNQVCVGTGDAGACVCNGNSCNNGCCEGSTCRAGSTTSCGIGGNVCDTCDLDVANLCSGASGNCQCGTFQKCDALLGQRCASDAGISSCVCDRISCPNG